MRSPRPTEFYVLFERAGANALEAARLVERRFREHPNSAVTQEQVKAVETAGDEITRELIQLLNTQYVTPFDREDIYQLATEIDDVVDYVEEASRPARALRHRVPTRHAVEQCAIIVAAVEQLCGRARRASRACAACRTRSSQLKQLEDEGDRVVRDAIAALFRDNRIDPLIVIRWKDIYEALERGARRLRDGRERDREHRRQERLDPQWTRDARRRRRRRALLRLHERLPRHGELDRDERLDARAVAARRGGAWRRSSTSPARSSRSRSRRRSRRGSSTRR